MRYLLDTSVVSNVMWPRPIVHLRARLESHAAASAISATVWHELEFGVARMPHSKRRDKLEVYLAEVRDRFEVLPYDLEAAEWHAHERARLMAVGLSAPFADGQIASVAATKNLVLATANAKDFEHFRGLVVEDWTQP